MFKAHSLTSLIKIIHIAGTKGKGSVCHYINALLVENFLLTMPDVKTGLFISPHITDYRERICINSKKLPHDRFDAYVSTARMGLNGTRLGYFRSFTLYSFIAFLLEKVSVAVYETGVGGLNDSTNVVEKPVVTGITRIGMDHIRTLGPSLRDIAAHKAGIIKKGRPVFTVSQEPEVWNILKERADECQSSLIHVTIAPELHCLPGAQAENASLAWAITRAFFKETGLRLVLSQDQAFDIMRHTNVRGRYQVILQHRTQWLIDGAHNTLCVPPLIQWINQTLAESESRHVP